MTLRILAADWAGFRDQLRAVREAVFIVEQNIPRELEWDGADDAAAHFLATDDGRPVGTARLLSSGQIGRMAVLRPFRRRGVGAKLLATAVGHARALGHRRVFLHAQVEAAAFYARAGFRSTGEVFIEAGIPHVAMEQELAIDSPSTRSRGDALARRLDHVPRPPISAWPPTIAPASGTRRIHDEATMRDAIAETARQARRQIRIYSQQLDPPLYDTPDLERVLSDLARRHPSTSIRILIHDSGRIVQIGHRLLKLSHRLSSSIRILAVIGEQRLEESSYVLADERGLVFQPKHTEYFGFAHSDDAVLVRQKLGEFDSAWQRAVEDPNLRQLRL